MSESRPGDSSPPPDSTSQKAKTSFWSHTFLITAFLAPVVAAAVLYQLDSFDPAPLPIGELSGQQPVSVPVQNSHMLQGAEKVGVGRLFAPEDLAYDSKSGVIYTGCDDGWIKRVTVNESAADSVVEEWVNTGGRPLGLVLGHNNEVIVADADKGLLRVSKDGEIEVLTKEAEGVEFRLTDGVDITNDGVIYFTDASSKYGFKEAVLDILEGRPYGRLLSYDPSTTETRVLLRDLYFANGVTVSPDQHFLVFCETPMMRCKKYYIQGERKGSVDKFVDNLPGMPDNIRYDGEGHYWIALASAATYSWDLAQRYPYIRKILGIMKRYAGVRPLMAKNGGFVSVDLGGKLTAHYHDPDLSFVSTGLKIADQLYCGSIRYPYIIRLNLTRYPAVCT